MSRLVRIGDLEVNQDMGYQRRWWRVQDASAVVMALVIVAALVGAFGSGPFSDVTERAPGLQLTYDRFPRLQAPTEIEIELRGGGGATDFGISRDYLAGMRIDEIQPEPDSTTVLPDRLVYTFEQTPPSLVVMRLEPQRPGSVSGLVHGPGDRPATLSQFVYP